MIDQLIHRLHEKYLPCEDGDIMPTTRGKSSHFALAVTSVDGSQWTAGDADTHFTLQSLTKPLAYAVALSRLEEDDVHAKVNVEPSREPYNAIELEEDTGRPSNAMLNAGAIALAGLMTEKFGDDAWEHVQGAISSAAGHDLSIDDEIYQSERQSGHSQRAMAYLMRGNGLLKGDPEAAVDLYFRQCSILLNCRDLSSIAATLANKGINPHSEEKVFEPDAVRHVLSVMLSCGMYDSSGEWIYRVGIPAKSGVSGGLLGVVNRQIGIATYSPPLDSESHSVRGIKAFADISAECSLHVFHSRNHGSNVLHDEFEG